MSLWSYFCPKITPADSNTHEDNTPPSADTYLSNVAQHEEIFTGYPSDQTDDDPADDDQADDEDSEDNFDSDGPTNDPTIRSTSPTTEIAPSDPDVLVAVVKTVPLQGISPLGSAERKCRTIVVENSIPKRKHRRLETPVRILSGKWIFSHSFLRPFL